MNVKMRTGRQRGIRRGPVGEREKQNRVQQKEAAPPFVLLICFEQVRKRVSVR